MHINVNVNEVYSFRKVVTQEIADGQIQSAKIHARYALRQNDEIETLRSLSVMCSCLLTKSHLIQASKGYEIPILLIESIGTVIYCRGKVAIVDLDVIAEQLEKKYLEKYLKMCMVSPTVRFSVEKSYPQSCDVIALLMTDHIV